MKRAKIVTLVTCLLCLFAALCWPISAEAGVITTLVVREKAGATTEIGRAHV